MTKDEFSDMLAHSLEERAQLLKIMSMNHYDMETGSRPEHLTAFKVVYGESIRTAMEEANVNYVFMTIYKMTFNCVRRLLNGKC